MKIQILFVAVQLIPLAFDLKGAGPFEKATVVYKEVGLLGIKADVYHLRFHIDPDRIAVTGGSAGGYLTLATGHRVRPRPRALLAYFGYGDLIGDWYSTPSPYPRHNQRPITAEEAWREVSGPAVAEARERKGDGGMFYNFCRQNGQWPKAVSGWTLTPNPKSSSLSCR